MNLNEMRKRKEKLMSRKREEDQSSMENQSSNQELLDDIRALKKEVERVHNITVNAKGILDDIDAEFERITALNQT